MKDEMKEIRFNFVFCVIKIFDESNVDVTPKPLFDADAGTKTRSGSGLYQSLEGTSTPTDIMSNTSMLNTNAILTGATSFGNVQE